LIQAISATKTNLAATQDFTSIDTTINSIPCTITRKTFANMPSADIRTERKNLEPLWNFLAAQTKSAAGGPIGYTALNALRLEQNIPWFGYDFGEKQIPHEAGLENSHISYVKGCYTGQEIVERVRSRGQVNRRRVSLRFPTTQQPPPAGTALTADGREVGTITSASPLPPQQNHEQLSIGRAYVRKESAAPGTELAFTSSEGQGKAVVT
jgi:folate-binding protein YgfZ